VWGSCVREWVLAFLRNEGVEVVSEKVRAVHAAVSVEDSEVCRFLPVVDMLRFGKVEDDGYSILIVLSNWSLVGGGRVSAYGPVSVARVFGRFEVGDRQQCLGQRRMFVLICAHSAFLYIEGARLDEDLLSDDFVYVFDRRF
jgi:hypothetical protein